jgi:dipeptidyl aminopeptidase/acylaminoacyl peptidase
VAVVAAAITAAPAGAAFPGANGKIAYNGSGGIYRINPDGSNNELVKSGDVRNAVWSSDGTKIAYLTSANEIRITAADGTGSTLVCTCIDSESDLTWSPDGTKFAFDKRVNGVYQILVVNSDGTGLTQITNGATGEEFSAAPDWSPDGTKIAFHRPGPSIWVMNSDGSGAVDLTGATRDYDFPNPSWSPDGTKIVFNRQGGIWTMNADGTDQIQLTIHGPGHAEDHHPTWSPDGRQILFTGWIDDAFNSGLVVMDADGSGRTAITGTSGSRLPDWQPIAPGYPRPKGATPFRLALVPASQACTAPNRTHGPPLAFGSCAPPQRASSYLTVGTPDANGLPALSMGFMKAEVMVGNPATQTDEADVQLSLSLTDVRDIADLADYGGALSARLALRRTDKESQPFSSTPATMVDLTFSFDATCAPTAGSEGATCSAQTSADALVPSSVQEGRRAIWELGPGRVFDGGADGDTATQGNTLFAVGGLFVP